MENVNTFQVLPDEIPRIKFNVEAQEQFGNDRGIVFEHWAAVPSAIGMKERGEYRRSDQLDTISSNGFIYKKVGEFVGTIVSNSLTQQPTDGGIYDNSTARLILPKFYKVVCKSSEQKEIALLPGDRLYVKNIELIVSNYQLSEYNPNGVSYIQFPIKNVDYLIDSRNVEYQQGVNFKIDQSGDIRWIDGKGNPGVDPDTGKGRVFSIRYTYLAFWYVSALINEIRVTNIDQSENPVRLPYHVQIQREYIYYNKVKPAPENTIQVEKRANKGPIDPVDPNQYEIKVNINNIEE
ncbi:MAG: hypothetical protein PHF86_09665 [Candidatus Nanoarchaeia archaeon]|jgi:hypothetical protein|nr:hypothetical protein [Candidatus Nanoarchaeia archaeon]